MTRQEAFYIVGNIPVPADDNAYGICQYQEAKAIALDCIQNCLSVEAFAEWLCNKYEVFEPEDDGYTLYGDMKYHSKEELLDEFKAEGEEQ